jgi:NAD-dependent deacetylase sirtuin 4
MLQRNVLDRLHHRVGSNPIELHGTTHTVICLECGHKTGRHEFQDRVCELNPEVHPDLIKPFNVFHGSVLNLELM